MSIDLLDTPLRMTWNLHGALGSPTAEQALALAAEMTASGVFFVTLEGRALAHEAIEPVLNALSSGGCRVLLVCEGSEGEMAALRAGLPIDTLFFDMRPYISSGSSGDIDFDALGAALASARDLGYEPALMMEPLRSNIRLLPRLLAFCRKEKVGKIKLPNIKIDGNFSHPEASDLLRPEDLDEFAALLGEDPPAHRENVALEVHDLFLWELFFPDGDEGGRGEYGGCQAGNSLAHLDEAGNLFPCSSWPEKLGSLLDESLEDIWAGPRRLRVRREIDAVPPGCAGCRDYALCLGGCRGLSGLLGAESGGRDLLCKGPR